MSHKSVKKMQRLLSAECVEKEREEVGKPMALCLDEVLY